MPPLSSVPPIVSITSSSAAYGKKGLLYVTNMLNQLPHTSSVGVIFLFLFLLLFVKRPNYCKVPKKQLIAKLIEIYSYV